MADRSSQLLLNALTRAAVEPGVSLFGSKTTPGLFPASAPGKLAAQRCRDDGYLRVESDGKSSCILTQKGMDFLVGHCDPREVLEDFVRILESRESQVLDLVSTARRMQGSLEALRDTVTQVLTRIGAREHPGSIKTILERFYHQPDPSAESSQESTSVDVATIGDWIFAVLLSRPANETLQDCPLPELYRAVTTKFPDVSIGVFHDALRLLVSQGRLRLHPWTAPLYDIPKPEFALMIGHAITYYARAEK